MPGAQLYRWSFTYFLPKKVDDSKYSSDKDEKKVADTPATIADRIKSILDGMCKTYIFQCERAPTTGSLHMQGSLNLHKKVTQGTLILTLARTMPGITISPCSESGKVALDNYCMKEDTRVAGPWKDKKATEKDAAKPTLWDVPVFNGKPLYRWQQSIVDIVSVKCKDNRTINWIVDKDGNIGKSCLAKYLYHKYKIPILPYAKAADLLNYVSKNMGKLAYMFDLNRTKPTDFTSNDIYSTLESIKNGMIFNGKFQTELDTMDPPHVWVFANFHPNQNKLTSDRWKLWEVLNKKLHPYKPAEEIKSPSEVPPEKKPSSKRN